MTRTLTLLAAALLAPALAGAYGGNYGEHCSPRQIRAGTCKTQARNSFVEFGGVTPPATGTATLTGPAAAKAAKGASTPMGGAAPPAPPPGVDPNAAAAAMSALKDAAPTNGKCPDGTTPVPGLNGTTRCIPGNLTNPSK